VSNNSTRPTAAANPQFPKVCVLSAEDVDEWIKTRVRPLCAEHSHVTHSTALRWHDYPRVNRFDSVEWVARNALLVAPVEGGLDLQPVRTGPYGIGYTVTQLVHGPGLMSSSRLPQSPAVFSRDVFRRIVYEPDSLPAAPMISRDCFSERWVSRLLKWEITIGEESCQFPDLLGLRYLHEIIEDREATVFSLLRANGVSTPDSRNMIAMCKGKITSAEEDDNGPDLHCDQERELATDAGTLRRVKREIAKGWGRATAARKAGNAVGYSEAMKDVIALRQTGVR
jgi:hypothetical protein